LISSMVSPSLPAARRSSASRRSPQQIGFIPAHVFRMRPTNARVAPQCTSYLRRCPFQ
jgi:hypothetical protein